MITAINKLALATQYNNYVRHCNNIEDGRPRMVELETDADVARLTKADVIQLKGYYESRKAGIFELNRVCT